VADEILEQVRNRLLPMLQLVAEQYRPRVAEGYPVVVDAVPQGLVGLEIDPNYALYITSEGGQLYADFYYRSTRNDVHSSASREKFAGSPIYDRRPISPALTEVQLRNMVAELMTRHNFQPGLVHITDS
jgi:hypothetical protein